MIYPTCERKEVWRPAMSTPLMELERDIDGVLDTVSTVNDFRSLKTNKDIQYHQLEKEKNLHNMLKTRFYK